MTVAADVEAQPVSARAAADESTSSLWRRWTEEHDRHARDTLILFYAPLVKWTARQVAARLPPHVDFDDLASWGTFGLIDAVERFDPTRDTQFNTYAVHRIRGAIGDGLRSMDRVPRNTRQVAHRIDETVEALRHRLQREPSEAEIVDELGTTRAKLMHGLQARREVEGGKTGGGAIAPHVLLELEDRLANIDRHIDHLEDLKALRQEVARLPRRQRTVIVLYYWEQLTLAEIGDLMGVTESRICQMHRRALAAMSASLHHQLVSAGI